MVNSENIKIEMVILALLFLFAGTFYYFYLGPSGQIVKNLNGSVSSLESKIKYLQNLDNANGNVEKFTTHLNKRGSFPAIIDDVSELGRKNNLTIPSIRYEMDSVNELRASRVKINFSIKGNYRDVRKFLSEMENIKHFLVIESLSLESNSALRRGKSKKKGVNMDMSVIAYFTWEAVGLKRSSRKGEF